jgi:AcrR family transcriptional regulator
MSRNVSVEGGRRASARRSAARPATKGERTREQIVESAAAVFNQKGYAGASIADVMEVTGLRKGGIYRHFESKEELAVAAFDFAVDRMADRFRSALLGQGTALGKLGAVIGVYAELPTNPPVPGGCPVLNTAVEADDSNPVLRERARQAVSNLLRFLAKLVREGQETGELRTDVVPSEVAHVVLCSLEGAVMLSQLSRQETAMRHTTEHLVAYLGSLAV